MNDNTLQKVLQFHLISWCRNFVERHSFRIASGDSFQEFRSHLAEKNTQPKVKITIICKPS